MAGLTKEQRLAKEAEKEALLKAELEAKIKAELEVKLRAEYEEKMKESSVETSKIDRAKAIQNSVKIPLDTVVPVVCNTVGGLIYVSKKINGYVVKWDGLGSTEYMELSELVSLRNTDRRFFEDNWIVFEDTAEYTVSQLYDFLKVSKYFEHVYTPETIDTIFELEPSDIIRTVSSLSVGMKDTVATRAKQKIDAKELDSNNKIEALEKALNVTFNI